MRSIMYVRWLAGTWSFGTRLVDTTTTSTNGTAVYDCYSQEIMFLVNQIKPKLILVNPSLMISAKKNIGERAMENLSIL